MAHNHLMLDAAMGDERVGEARMGGECMADVFVTRFRDMTKASLKRAALPSD